MMSAGPKQTHSDLFFKIHVAGRAFHTHAVVHYSGSVSSLVYSHIHLGQLLNLMNPRKHIKTLKGNGAQTSMVLVIALIQGDTSL